LKQRAGDLQWSGGDDDDRLDLALDGEPVAILGDLTTVTMEGRPRTSTTVHEGCISRGS
jgi:hypothetical protein